MKKMIFSLLFIAGGSSVWALDSRTSENRPGNCRVRTWAPHNSFSNRCIFSDEVMVGFSEGTPSYALCAKLQVDCNRDEDKKPTKESESLEPQIND